MNRVFVGAVMVPVLSAGTAQAQPPTGVLSQQKISDTQGGFTRILDDGDYFGFSVASLVDLDGDGVTDLAMGARLDDDGSTPPNANRGAVWILFPNTTGTANSHQKISEPAHRADRSRFLSESVDHRPRGV